MIKFPTRKHIDLYKDSVSAEQLILDLNAAEELIFKAMDSDDIENIIKLIKKSLKKSPLCADAYCFYCQIGGDFIESKVSILQTALYAAEVAIEEDFEEYEGHFWGLTETRPYMRTKAMLLDALWESGNFFAAITHGKEMLKLNPNDNQGVRYQLASYYLELELIEELVLLLDESSEDKSSTLQYSRALLAYRNSSPNVEEIVKTAFISNNHIPQLLETRCVQDYLDTGYITLGGKDEAINYVNQNIKPWIRTPGAIDWINKEFKLKMS